MIVEKQENLTVCQIGEKKKECIELNLTLTL